MVLQRKTSKILNLLSRASHGWLRGMSTLKKEKGVSMTRNQIEYQKTLETRRANLESERESRTHNRATEGISLGELEERRRSNRATEALKADETLARREGNLLSYAGGRYSADRSYESHVQGAAMSSNASRYGAELASNASRYASLLNYQTGEENRLAQRANLEYQLQHDVSEHALDRALTASEGQSNRENRTFNTMLGNTSRENISAAERASREAIARANRETKVSEGKLDREQRNLESIRHQNTETMKTILNTGSDLAKTFTVLIRGGD